MTLGKLTFALLLASLATPTWAVDKTPSARNFMEDLALQEEFVIGGRKAFLYARMIPRPHRGRSTSSEMGRSTERVVLP